MSIFFFFLELYCPTNKDGDIVIGNSELPRMQNDNNHANYKSCQLSLMSGDVSRMMFDDFGIDLIELQNRYVMNGRTN